MREHPIPQDITGYRFHIIGSMTLKQFIEIAGGVVIAVIVYKLGLPSILTWPIIILSVSLGFGLAFLPIEERPLDHWFITYFKIMFRSTKFFWKKTPHIPDIFRYQPPSGLMNREPEIDLSPARRARVKEYLTAVHQVDRGDNYERALNVRVGSILQQFQDPSLATAQGAPNPLVGKPALEPRIRTLRNQTEVKIDVNLDHAPVEVIVKNDESSPGQPQEQERVDLTQNEVVEETTKLNRPEEVISTTISTTPMMRIDQVAGAIEMKSADLIKIGQREAKEEAGTVKVPATEVTQLREMTQLGGEQKVAGGDPSLPPATLSPLILRNIEHQPEQVGEPTQTSDAIDATFNAGLPFPSTPTQANRLVGMVLNANRELVPGAIVEVKDQRGSVVRVVKSNALGQFFITAPLNNGHYTLTTQASSLTFPPLSFQVNNTILKPLEVQALT